MKCDPEVSESTTAPGETDGDQEFSSSDSSANEAEHAPSSQMPPSANLTTQNGGISTAHDSQPTQAPPGAGQPVHQDAALSSTVNSVLQEQDPAHSTVQELSDSLDFLAGVSRVFQVSHPPQVENFLRQRYEHVANVFHDEQRDHGRMFNVQL